MIRGLPGVICICFAGSFLSWVSSIVMTAPSLDREKAPVDFRGLSPKAFDGQGNYNMGIAEQIAFPEIDYDKIDKLRGLNISITTSAGTDEEGRALLSAFQFPFRG